MALSSHWPGMRSRRANSSSVNPHRPRTGEDSTMATPTPAQAVAPSEEGAHSLFVRDATGLVRNISGSQNIGLNFIAGLPSIALALGLFFALTGFPGGSIFLGIILTLPFTLAFAYAFGMMSAVIPRSGGDYMIVSRVLHPLWGLVSSSCMLLAYALSAVFVGVTAFVDQGVAPGLITLGLSWHSHTLVTWGNTVATSKGWELVLGCALIVVCAAVTSLGWTATRRAMYWTMIFSIVGVVVSAVVALVASRASFIAHFDAFAHPFTGSAHSYQDTLAAAQKAGVNLHPGFSLAQSLPIVGVMAGFGIYTWNSAFVAGELRQGNTLKTAHRMAYAGILSLVALGLFAACFFKGWGQDFLTAAYGGGFPHQLGPVPGYFLLTAAQLGSPIVSFLMVMSFLAGFACGIVALLLVTSRILFAWSFDGILPQSVTKVSQRGAPYVAVAVMTVLTLVCAVWAVYVASSFIQIVVYATLIQLVAMGLVAVSAIVFAYRRPELYRGSVSQRTLWGVPWVAIAGGVALLACAILYYLFFKYSYFGLASKGKFFVWLGGAMAFGVLWYFGARLVRRRQGVDLDLVFAEIPPE
jgi:APA family basic amino acid/polyamine antiporter